MAFYLYVLNKSFLGSLEAWWRVCGIVFREDFQKSIILYKDEGEVFTEEVLEEMIINLQKQVPASGMPL